MLELGQRTASRVVVRTFSKGRGLDDKRLPKHSELKAMGKVKGPSHKRGAYSKAYGDTVKKGKTTGRVTLIENGHMMRQFRVLRYSKSKVQIGPSGSSVKYAAFTHRLRPWIGLTAKERIKLIEDVRGVFKRARRGSN